MKKLALRAALASAILALLRGAPTAAQSSPADIARVQLLGFNDFHGALLATRPVRGRPAGSAAVLAAYLRDESARFPGGTLIVHAGDHVGASPPESGLLRDEPSILFLNLLGNRFCTPKSRFDARCNLVGTLGNHEFDDGVSELLRLYRGGSAKRGPRLERTYSGAAFPLVSANVVEVARNRHLLTPYVIKELEGVRIGVIGAVTRQTPELVVASGVRSVRFSDEAEAVNRAARELEARGVRAIVLSIHHGEAQPAYEGATRSDAVLPGGGFREIATRLDPAIDVVISGHAHAFTNALLERGAGAPLLITQAFSSGTAYAAVELTIDRVSGEVMDKRARIMTAYADRGPGLTPAEDVADLVERARRAVAPVTERVVATAVTSAEETPNEAGESALGNLIADAQRAAMHADVALMNQGGIRTSLAPGPIRWGDLFAIHPFANRLVAMDLSGAQLLEALEQQWRSEPPRLLQVSGLSYAWSPERPVGSRVIDVRVGTAPLEAGVRYRVVVNSFLAEGGGDFEVFRRGARRAQGPLDLDALVAFLERQESPIRSMPEGRIRIAKRNER